MRFLRSRKGRTLCSLWLKWLSVVVLTACSGVQNHSSYQVISDQGTRWLCSEGLVVGVPCATSGLAVTAISDRLVRAVRTGKGGVKSLQAMCVPTTNGYDWFLLLMSPDSEMPLEIARTLRPEIGQSEVSVPLRVDVMTAFVARGLADGWLRGRGALIACHVQQRRRAMFLALERDCPEASTMLEALIAAHLGSDELGAAPAPEERVQLTKLCDLTSRSAMLDYFASKSYNLTPTGARSVSFVWSGSAWLDCVYFDGP